MYLMITSRCNMTCAHCCSRCTEKGEDMTLATWENAVEFAKERGEEYVSIGGGEPTVHPLFWQILGSALGEFGSVWMATNGKLTKTALALAGLSKGSETFGVALSQDPFHEPINERVVAAFRNAKLELRDTSRNLSNTGRAKDNNLGHDDHCVCGGLLIKPDGGIYPCGCEDAPRIGNVNKGGVFKKYRAMLDVEEYTDCECWTGYQDKIS